MLSFRIGFCASNQTHLNPKKTLGFLILSFFSQVPGEGEGEEVGGTLQHLPPPWGTGFGPTLPLFRHLTMWIQGVCERPSRSPLPGPLAPWCYVVSLSQNQPSEAMSDPALSSSSVAVSTSRPHTTQTTRIHGGSRQKLLRPCALCLPSPVPLLPSIWVALLVSLQSPQTSFIPISVDQDPPRYLSAVHDLWALRKEGLTSHSRREVKLGVGDRSRGDITRASFSFSFFQGEASYIYFAFNKKIWVILKWLLAVLYSCHRNVQMS